VDCGEGHIPQGLSAILEVALTGTRRNEASEE
jgi:hypothetical protein